MKKIILAASMLASLSFNANAEKLRGKVSIDGSSTVFPITEAVAEEYRAEQPRVKVNIGVSGTGGGFKKILNGEIDINDASRKIKAKEQKIADEKGIKMLEIPVAYDGITVVINPKNTWATNMTQEQLHKLWMPGSTVKKWSDLDPSWPKEDIKLYGPGTDSGTFDYFTKAINGKSGKSRSDYTMSEDDNVLVTGVIGDKNALGYFGYAYYKENAKKLKAVAVNGVSPNVDSIRSGEYKPLARAIFIYVNTKSLAKKEVKNFVQFYLNNAGSLVEEVGYVPLAEKDYKNFVEKL
jgi:phosphate transport system substrate-binding protein